MKEGVFPTEIIIRPLGPQGPMVGVSINSKEELSRLDEETDKLSDKERRTYKGTLEAVQKAGLKLIDF